MLTRIRLPRYVLVRHSAPVTDPDDAVTVETGPDGTGISVIAPDDTGTIVTDSDDTGPTVTDPDDTGRPTLMNWNNCDLS